MPTRGLFRFSLLSFAFTVASILLQSCGGGGGISSTTTPTAQASQSPTPTLTAISTSTTTVGTNGLSVTVTGTGFVGNSVVQWNGSARSTTFVNSTQLQVTLTAADLATSGTAQITVFTPPPGGGTTAPMPMTINNPSPAISSFSPSSLTTFSAGMLAVNGSGFVQTSAVTWNGQPHNFIFESTSRVLIPVGTAEVANTGNALVAITNGAPGGGTTSASLPIVYPAPTLTGASPAGIQFGSNAFTLTVTGTGFTPASSVMWNGTARTTTYVNANQLKAAIAAADVANVGTAAVTVSTPTPGGGTSGTYSFTISGYPFPNITGVTPNSAVVNSPDTMVRLLGVGFSTVSTVQVGGATVPSTYSSISGTLSFTMPAANLAAVQTYAITVTNPTPGGGVSSPVTFNVVPNPQPVLTGMYPATAAVGTPSLTLTLNGSGFSPNSVVRWNGSDRATTFVSSSQITATVTATDLSTLGNASILVFNGPPGGGTSSPLPFTTYLPLAANDLVYSNSTHLIYASVPAVAGAPLGNSIVPIDPVTGNLGTPIWVGSDPGRMALSSDGNTLYVGLTGAAAVRQVDLTTSTPGIQFSLGGGSGTYNPPNSPTAIAIMPGSPNTVAVGFSNATWWNGGITIFDSGVPRSNSSNTGGAITGVNGVAFDPSGTKIYAAGQGYAAYPVTSSGVGTALVTNSSYSSDLRLDNGRVYLTNGVVLDAATGNQLGVFSTAPNTQASGPVAPDSGLAKAFILLNSYAYQNQINVYDLNSFVALGNIPLGITGQSSTIQPRLIRWGQNGLAFTNGAQIFILTSSLVADLSSAVADLGLSVSAPASAATGSPVTLTYTVTNHGSAVANPVTFADQLPSGISLVSIQTSVGSCAGTTVVRCDLGTLTAGASATIQISVAPLTAGTMQDAARVSAPQGDPDLTNNTRNASVVVAGADFNPVPAIASVSPSLVAKGATNVTLTVNGDRFGATSLIEWNGVALPTTFVSTNQLTAPVTPSQLAAMGWAWVNVTNAVPGGGSSAELPVTIYDTIALDANNIIFDPYTRKIYASVPSTATQVTGNSIVAVDPNTPAMSAPVAIGSEPSKMAVSDDGKYLYVILRGSNSLSRIDLTSGSAAGNYSLAVQNTFGSTPDFRDLAVQPGNHDTLAIDLGSWLGKGIFDISGNTGTYRGGGALTGPYNGSSLVFPNANQLYSYDRDTSGALFYRWNVTNTGLTPLDNSTINGMGGFSGLFRLDHGLVYGGQGGLADPTTSPAKQLGQYPVYNFFGPNQSVGAYSVAPDATLNRVFYLGQTLAGYANNYLLSFDQQRLTPLAANLLPSGAGTDLLRWGRDGLAMRFTNGTAGSGLVLLLRGPLVLPQWATSSPTPALTTLSNATIASGSGNQILSVTGSGFVPGGVVLWNGKERSTTYVDSSHLQFAVAAADVATPGVVTITTNNPGTSASNALTLTVQ